MMQRMRPDLKELVERAKRLHGPRLSGTGFPPLPFVGHDRTVSWKRCPADHCRLAAALEVADDALAVLIEALLTPGG